MTLQYTRTGTVPASVTKASSAATPVIHTQARLGLAEKRTVGCGRQIQWMISAMPEFYRRQVASLKGLNLSWRVSPEVADPSAEKHVPAAFRLALGWVEKTQRQYNNASASEFYEEIADCSGFARPG